MCHFCWVVVAKLELDRAPKHGSSMIKSHLLLSVIELANKTFMRWSIIVNGWTEMSSRALYYWGLPGYYGDSRSNPWVPLEGKEGKRRGSFTEDMLQQKSVINTALNQVYPADLPLVSITCLQGQIMQDFIWFQEAPLDRFRPINELEHK